VRINNPPESAALMATARSFGNYDLAAALADLIDNSIKANAENISISFIPEADDVRVSIIDDGEGMDAETLIKAMRPASTHPDTERHPDDLGRFGWGLKTASLSQAKILTVVTWQQEQFYAARWNIDDIDDWAMDYLEDSEARNELTCDPESDSGTEVIWSNTDRLVDREHELDFDESLSYAISQARQHLSLIFHRFILGEGGAKISISINGNPLQPVDPFMKSHPATQTLDLDVIKMPNGSKIEIQPYVLPHFSKLTHEEQSVLGGPEGMVRNQGFYVYRNRRLIIHGTWFRIVPHGELSQLTRVRVDLPNTVDHDWRITVDKSGAQLPTQLKRRLKEVIKKFNRKSVRVHRKKGVSLDRTNRTSVWLRIIKNGRIRYVVNRDHPMLTGLYDSFDDPRQVQGFKAILTLLESYFPTDAFVSDAEKTDSSLNQTLTSEEEFEALVMQCIINYRSEIDGKPSVTSFLDFLRKVEPFASQWKYTESLVGKMMPESWEK
jgi:hypothetical protein